jgi:hypothetical protein
MTSATLSPPGHEVAWCLKAVALEQNSLINTCKRFQEVTVVNMNAVLENVMACSVTAAHSRKTHLSNI